jgi:diaminopimelate decarboxylase
MRHLAEIRRENTGKYITCDKIVGFIVTQTGFHRQGGALWCDAVPLSDIAAAEGTPLYVYSASIITERYQAIVDAFSSYPPSLHYALKANSTLAIARLLRSLGAGADANSGGEIDVALRAGFIPAQIVFTGVGKSSAELAQAIDLGVMTINAESTGEIERIDRLAIAREVRARVALRVNPDIDAKSHPHISTGLKTNKFGVPITAVKAICQQFVSARGVEIVGLHIHVGSQITDLQPLRKASEAIVALARELRDVGVTIDHVDLGGGLGVSYDGSPVPSAREYADALLPAVRHSGLRLILEPGRNIIAPAGVLLSQVIDVKPQSADRLFAILDAGMTELIRPMLYSAFHRIEHVNAINRPPVVCDVVGPLCESSDTLGKDRMLARPEVGDLMAVRDTGAYAAVMASNYNRRVFAPEVLVDGSGWRVVRRRQTIDDLLALEV